jgi:hypothetical protein
LQKEKVEAHACDSFVLCDHAPSAAASEIARQTNKQEERAFSFLFTFLPAPAHHLSSSHTAQQGNKGEKYAREPLCSFRCAVQGRFLIPRAARTEPNISINTRAHHPMHARSLWHRTQSRDEILDRRLYRWRWGREVQILY